MDYIIELGCLFNDYMFYDFSDVFNNYIKGEKTSNIALYTSQIWHLFYYSVSSMQEEITKSCNLSLSLLHLEKLQSSKKVPLYFVNKEINELLLFWQKSLFYRQNKIKMSQNKLLFILRKINLIIKDESLFCRICDFGYLNVV